MSALTRDDVVATLDRWEDGYLVGEPLVRFLRAICNPRTIADEVLASLDAARLRNVAALLSVADDLGVGSPRTLPEGATA